jgi:hypothetical protein
MQHVPEMTGEGGPTTDEILYFAYGSNMSSARLRPRVTDLPKGTVARLASYVRTFDKPGTYGGKTNIRKTTSDQDSVPGVLFALTQAQLAALADFEDGYMKQEIIVTLGDGTTRKAWTFIAEKTEAGLQPTRSYLRHLIVGAREHGFAKDEITAIEATETMD